MTTNVAIQSELDEAKLTIDCLQGELSEADDKIDSLRDELSSKTHDLDVALSLWLRGNIIECFYELESIFPTNGLVLLTVFRKL